MNKDILFRILEQWHEEDQFQKIIDTIHDLPEEELDYDLKSHLARAKEKMAKYLKENGYDD